MAIVSRERCSDAASIDGIPCRADALTIERSWEFGQPKPATDFARIYRPFGGSWGRWRL